MTDIAAAAQFIAAHARLIDRRRFALLEGDGSADDVLRALAAYRNDDGGIGHLEPDLRTPASQPACVTHALEILHEVGAADTSLADRRARLAADGHAARRRRPVRAPDRAGTGRARRGSRRSTTTRRRRC